jgi:hypothetical protein
MKSQPDEQLCMSLRVDDTATALEAKTRRWPEPHFLKDPLAP